MVATAAMLSATFHAPLFGTMMIFEMVGDLRFLVPLILGAGVLLVGLGLLTGSALAQVLAVFLVAINAIGQVFTISVYPWWGLTALVLDVFVIWALCVYRPMKL